VPYLEQERDVGEILPRDDLEAASAFAAVHGST
jgi:hypothetical protein